MSLTVFDAYQGRRVFTCQFDLLFLIAGLAWLQAGIWYKKQDGGLSWLRHFFRRFSVADPNRLGRY